MIRARQEPMSDECFERKSTESIAPDVVARIEALTPRLLAWSRFQLRSVARVEPEDLVQEVWCRVVAIGLDAGAEHFDHQVFRTARYVLLEVARKARQVGRTSIADGHTSRVRELQVVADTVSTITQRVARREACAALLRAGEELGDDDRQVFVLCGLEGLTAREAGARIGASSEAVTKRWQRLRARLRDLDLADTA